MQHVTIYIYFPLDVMALIMCAMLLLAAIVFFVIRSLLKVQMYILSLLG